MSQITVVTTFHADGMRKYGQRFIDSFIQKVDKRITLLVYAEECAPYISNNQQVTLLNANIELPKLIAFKEKWKRYRCFKKKPC